jgi:AcrR family transcriptional regulator
LRYSLSRICILALMKSETRKDEIINTAAKLFKEKGYSAVTMRDLATAMGMKAASLYNHINSKQDILKVIIICIAEEFTNGMDIIISSEESNIDKLKKIVSLHVDITSHNTSGMASLNNDWMHLEDHLEYYLKLRNEYEANFLKIIKTGITTSEIKNSNPEIIMFSMLTTLRSLYLWIPKKEDLNANDLANGLSQVLIDGINN